MTVSAVIGMQWGDEGKGKIVDILGETADVVVRCQGGGNAGHTVVVGSDVFKLHFVPSGILRDGVTAIIGNGVVADPLSLVEEIAGLEERGIDVDGGRLLLSDRAQLVLPTHRLLDGLSEANLGAKKIGTTGRGIGPAYASKAERTGLRGYDMLDPSRFAERLHETVVAHNRRIEFLGGEPVDVDDTVDAVRKAVDRLRPLVADTVAFVHEALEAGRNILLEGAQGAQLDIDFGTYPYVTSSNTTSGGLATGSGVAPNRIEEVNGVLKVFTTRVGEGPFVTELDGDEASRLRGTGENQWDEFGTTTGRPRRCGWLDLVPALFAARINGVTRLHLTKLDVLSGIDPLRVCVAYDCDGTETRTMPADVEALERCAPVYEELPGWSEPITGVSSLDDMPAAAREYVRFIADRLGSAVGSISVGPGRDDTILAGD